MIKKYADAKAEKSATSSMKLPAGGYVCQVISAKVEKKDWGDSLVLAFDVLEGEFKGFFAKQFEANTNEDKKWKGTFGLGVPADDGSEKDGWAKRKMNNLIYALEDSNPGYSWDWDEAKLKGKVVGVVFRNKEWEMNGNTGWTTKAGAIYDAASIRSGNYKQLDDLPLKNKTENATPAFTPMSVADESELPF